MEAYVAGGWFSPEQEKALEDIKSALCTVGIEFYSPREDCLYIPHKTLASEVFAENISQIEKADFLLASTAGKDMGTLFECGYAHAIGKPIMYYFTGPGKFNLMLSESGHCVATSYSHLVQLLTELCVTGKVPEYPYYGGKE